MAESESEYTTSSSSSSGSGATEWTNSNRLVSLYIGTYLLLFLVVIVLSKFLHDRPRLGSFIPEAALMIVVGLVAGTLIHLVVDTHIDNSLAQDLLSFSPTVFFMVLLPPIIFNGAHHMRRDLFFRYITPIGLYACLGTTVCALAVGGMLWACVPLFANQGGETTAAFLPTFWELLAFGALISATDPVSTLAVFSTKKVDPHLFYLVFGESVINDAVGLILYENLAHVVEQQQGDNANQLNVGHEIMQFLFSFVVGFVGSLILGILIGIGYALIFKKIDFSHTPLLQLCFYVTILYVPLVLAEICHLSGIVTVLFAGASSAAYVEPNLTPTTAAHADSVFRLTSHVAETIVFLEMGMSVCGLVGAGHTGIHYVFLACAVAACLIGRALNVYPITWAYNMTAPWRQKRSNQQKSKLSLSDEDADQAMGYVQQGDGITTKESQQAVQPEMSTMGNSIVQIDDTTIPWKSAHMLWFSGLRGAVSYGLVKTFPETGNQNVFAITTMFIALITTFVFGGGTETALRFLNIDTGVDDKEYLKRIEKRPILTGWFRRFEEVMVRPWILKRREHTQDDHDAIQSATERHEALLSEQQQSGDLQHSSNDNNNHNDTDVEGAAAHHEHTDIELTEMTDNEIPHASIFDFGQ